MIKILNFFEKSLPYNENLNELKELLVNKIGLIQINEAETLTNLEPDAFQIFTQNKVSNFFFFSKNFFYTLFCYLIVFNIH